ncbi:MAG TPA: ROK family protein, partial [Acidimicrobiales bacterium]|nr:ROK family protein [Acidimicrobiales bacterium]
MGLHGFGVDIGGSGIKGAVVDLDAGALATERYKVLTPQPSTPGAVAAAVSEVVNHFGWQGPLGITFPAVVQHGVA